MTDNLIPTRAQMLNVKPKVLAARSLKTLASIRKQFPNLAAPWADIDNTVCMRADQLLAEFESFERYVKSAIDYLNEVPS